MNDTEVPEPPRLFASFDSLATARRATGAIVRSIDGYKPRDAVILESADGRRLLYVRPEATDYRALCEKVHGGRLSEAGYDADHVASRAIEAASGQAYVLLARVEYGANRSHGASYERPGKHLDRAFNRASLGPAATGGKGLAIPLSFRQSHKLSGRTASEIRRDLKALRHAGTRGLDDATIAHALFQDEASQRRIAAMAGPVLDDSGLP